ncbi:site-specific tyrosine recombinase XerD [Streptococcus castoreus]|uniref:site-specific tyrosine recombinase XerD n=1 Tax=Streptococcus castoreus TaxID=254786 RepID=UPI0003FD0A3E|nr:site-specific tyrosine recombinase XerD [Streptococcus castoreus]
MMSYIEAFIASKFLSHNTQIAYRYDLQQFCAIIGERVNKEKLSLYQNQLSPLSPSAKKRKLSTVNQFLYYLYQERLLEHYFKLSEQVKLTRPDKLHFVLMDQEIFYQETSFVVGQLIALLILELGLIPSEIASIKVENLDLTFQVLKLQTAKGIRILALPQRLLPFLKREFVGKEQYLFEHQGHSFSRQWYFNQLRAFVESVGQKGLTAQKLREQFILKEKSAGKSIIEVSQILGLKSPVTLEKYYKT